MKNNNSFSQPAPEKSSSNKEDDQALIPHKTDWLRASQFVFSLLAALILLGTSLISFFATLIQDSFVPLGVQVGSDLSPYLFAAGLGGMGLLMIPSVVYAGRQLFGQKSIQFHWGKIARIGFLAPLLILLGYGIQSGPEWARMFLPVIHVLANTTAVFWLLDFARKKVPDQSASRFWGTFGSGLGLTPLVTFFLEVLILIGIALIWIGLTDLMPGFRADLLELATQVQNSSGDPQNLQKALGEFVARPGVLFTLFTYVAFLIPVVEELLKPLAVWILLRKKIEPWEGFVIGATSGAGYALFENLTIGAAAEAWTFITLTRLGTTAVHTFTAGLMGWGWVSAFKEKKFFRAAGAYGGAVAVHGIWNGLNILAAVGEFAPVQDLLGPLPTGLTGFVPALLGVLALGCFWGLIRINKYFRRAIMAGSD